MSNILYMGIAQPSDPAVAVFSRSLLRSLQISRHQAYLYGDNLFYKYFKSPEIVKLST